MSAPDANAPRPDPIIDEVWMAREKISRRFGNDPRRLAVELQRLEQEMRAKGRRIIPAPDPAEGRGSKVG